MTFEMQYMRTDENPGQFHSLLCPTVTSSGPIELGAESSTAAKRAAASWCQGSEEAPWNTACDTATKRGQRESHCEEKPKKYERHGS